MKPVRIYAIFLRQLYLIRSNFVRFFRLFIWITADILLWGFVSNYLNAAAGARFSFLAVFLGAMLLWSFLTQVMQGVTMAFFEDVYARNFLNIFGSPLLVSEYMVGFMLTSIMTSGFSLVVMLFLAGIFFGFSILAYGLSFIPFLMILFLSGIALGIVGVSIVLRFGPPAEWFVWPIPAILSPFVGVLYPLSVLPHWMQFIGRLLPPSYVFEGVRAIVAGGGFSSGAFVVGLFLSLFYIALAYGIFLLVYRKAVRTGLIARYSAETLT
ncbi:MAG: ABC transporter permease [Minisyncoccia bacterium]|jgi:ABC-2 type transport system permease protein